jgi:predicted DNA-binding transcriptional regulator AlpA
MTELLTVREVAALLKVSKSKVYELIQTRTRSGDIRVNPLPHFRIGESVRFNREAVEQWLERLQQ